MRDSNARYHPLLLRAVPARAGRALDVGCGNGHFAARLAQVAERVVALDVDGPALERARRNASAPNVEFVEGHLLTTQLEPRSFDFVAAIAVVHHLDARAALERLKELARPGGRLAILGLARSGVRDLPRDALGSALHRLRPAPETRDEHQAPLVWPPPETYTTMRRLVGELLPGAAYARHLAFRYSVFWTA